MACPSVTRSSLQHHCESECCRWSRGYRLGRNPPGRWLGPSQGCPRIGRCGTVHSASADRVRRGHRVRRQHSEPPEHIRGVSLHCECDRARPDVQHLRVHLPGSARAIEDPARSRVPLQLCGEERGRHGVGKFVVAWSRRFPEVATAHSNCPCSVSAARRRSRSRCTRRLG
jgi:hypothetical protein